MAKPVSLSKSRVIEGLGCEKKIFLSINSPKLKAPVTKQKQAIFDQGNAVGILAQEQFPNGYATKVEYWDIQSGIKQTKEAIEAGNNTIYEAFFGVGTLNCRVDILHRKNSKSAWQLIEVKSGTSAKEEYVLDAAVQLFILKKAKVKVSKVYVMHINSDCRYPDLTNLFSLHDATDEVEELLSDFPKQIKKIEAVLAQSKEPKIDIGRHCTEPYECDFKDHCWKHVPDYSVFDLPLSWRLFERGYLGIKGIKPSDLSKSQQLPYQVAISGKRHIDSASIKKELKNWKKPFYHLDFETIGPAIPRFDGTKPYDSIPNQFSLHIQKDFKSKPQHFEYLHPDRTDPREAVAKKLIEWIPEKGGSVISYNSSFEAGVLKRLAEQFPKMKKHLLSISDRLLDPHPVIKANVYDKEFRGSFSIKDVAPALLGKDWSYDGLEVGDGKMAQIAFDEMTDPSTSPKRREEIKAQLLKYCAQDTMCMVKLLDWMASI